MSIPLTPDRATARDWLLRELSDPAYAPGPGLLDRIRALLAQWQISSSAVLWALLAVFVLLVAVVVLRFTGLPQRGMRRRDAPGSTDEHSEPVSAADFRARAERAAAEHRFDQAVVDRFRAIVRALEERAVLPPRAGRTADEAAREAGARLPDRGAELTSAALLFDDVCYGGRPGTPAGYAALSGIDGRVAADRPVDAAIGGPGRAGVP